MSTPGHWDRIYSTKAPPETSWYEPHLEVSLAWIARAAPDRTAAIIDAGGGESTLVDDLYAHGYRSLTVLDLSVAALEKTRRRLGSAAEAIQWISGDVTQVSLPDRAYDLWHDRAVFHFLTDPDQRAAYVRTLEASLRLGGRAVFATFGPQGPQKCSGLDTCRYDAESLARELGPAFHLVRSALIEHTASPRAAQQFQYCDFELC